MYIYIYIYIYIDACIVKPRCTKVELISSAKISTDLPQSFQSLPSKMAEKWQKNGEEAPLPHSLTAPSGSESCAAYPILISQDCPVRFRLS